MAKITKEMLEKIVLDTGCYSAMLIIITPDGKMEARDICDAPPELIPGLRCYFKMIYDLLLKNWGSEQIRGNSNDTHN